MFKWSARKIWLCRREKFPICTIGLNKVGMDIEEFNKYVFINIICLSPDAADILGMRVLLKINSGPVCNKNVIMCAWLRNLGIYLCSGVPTPPVSPKKLTRDMESSKWNMENLADLIADCLAARNKSLFFHASLRSLFFGGKDPESGIDCYLDAFGAAFNKEENVTQWEQLKKSKMPVSDNQMQIVLKEIQHANIVFWNLLTVQGFDGSLLCADLKQKKILLKHSQCHILRITLKLLQSQ